MTLAFANEDILSVIKEHNNERELANIAMSGTRSR